MKNANGRNVDHPINTSGIPLRVQEKRNRVFYASRSTFSDAQGRTAYPANAPYRRTTPKRSAR